MQAFNPYMPGWEYVPDGEPHVFGDRVYVYGSHDRFNGYVFCMNDYVCYSAPVDNLADWRYEGVIYKKTDDPLNPEGAACLYAPDVTRGPDGRYYLFYALDKFSRISVAVCDEPAGKYEFLGYVHDAEGRIYGEREGDEHQFDPGVLTEGDVTYLYTGFAGFDDPSRHGAMMTYLDKDMLTMLKEPVYVVPSRPYSKGTGFEGHEFFEASSIRKFGDTYYFVYSSIVMHELCYATSKSPDKDFVFGGVIVSNADMHIDTYKPADRPMFYGANNHGGLEKIGDDYYIFYHRHTNGTVFSRQAMAEKVTLLADGSIPQVEMTSCGLNGGPLKGEGYYPAYIACNLFHDVESLYTGGAGRNQYWLDSRLPRITQDGRDGDEKVPYIINMTDSATCGFKYFDMKGVCEIGLKVRGYCYGKFVVKTAWDGPVLAELPVKSFNVWHEFRAPIQMPDGVQALYLRYEGPGGAMLGGFTLYTK